MDTRVKNQENLENEISLKEIFLKAGEWVKYLISKWYLILIAGILGGALGLYYAYQQQPVYTAELTFALEDDQGGSGGYAGLASQFGLNLGGGGGGGVFAGENLIELMKSRSLIEKTLLTSVSIGGYKEITLAEYFIVFNKLHESWQDKPELKNLHFYPRADRTKFTLKQDSVLGKFYKVIVNGTLTVNRKDDQLGIIMIRVKSGNEQFAKKFVETLAEVVTGFYVETKTKKSVQNLAILQYQTDSVRRALNYAISGVAVSADMNPNPNPARRVLAVPSQRRTVDVQASQAILTELVKNLEISKMSLRRETPLIQVIDTPILPLDITMFGKRRGLMIGGIIGGFLMINYLLIRRFLFNR
ncbi:Wzz/FepE/Etk N-terminal domain-containing protein [Daejeonella lutea]|uniref:Chain length determinant protein n=1 Tax=Daejeonella lutea TaxID=572036 RepID=A0A1T5FCM9_9SPHI|nr:Wzz/FepE/Etk N-terminal domain-containing protein [Daejeonella lutea]SKB93867.1 Chain length determinant protein [Daejeonella lutea]